MLPLMDTSLLSAMLACENGELSETEIRFSNKASANVVLASGGYPGKYEKGLPITIGSLPENTHIVHAGTKRAEEGFVTAGGRVLNVVAVADDLPGALEKAYAGAANVTWKGVYFRRDIGKTAVEHINEVK